MSGSAPERSGTLIPRTTNDARPNKKRKRRGADALGQPYRRITIVSRRSKPDTMEDNPLESDSSGPDLTRFRLNHKTLNPSDKDMPTGLKALYMRLLPYQKEKMIMPRSCKAILPCTSKPIYKTLGDDAYYDLPGVALECAKQLLDDVDEIVNMANKCYSEQYDKTVWNNLVYTTIIKAAVKGVGGSMDSWRLDFSPCERAVIDPLYERKLPVKPHVDYMLFMVPHTDEGKDLHNLQGKLNGYSNFTNFEPTCKYSIMLNIKSKELQGEDLVSPELHLAA